MINQITREKIDTLSEEYRKLASKNKEAIKEFTISELPEIINRRSIQYVYLLMNMDYENALSLIRDTEEPNVFLCSKDFLLSNSLPTVNPNAYTDELSLQVDAIINRDIDPHVLDGFFSWNDYKGFKKAVIFIKNSDFVSEDKDEFIMTACSLMNIFLTAVFKITEQIGRAHV